MSNRTELKRGMRLIWHTTIWAIWKSINNIIFNNGSMEVGDVVDEIIKMSWKWSLARLKIQPCLSMNGGGIRGGVLERYVD